MPTIIFAVPFVQAKQRPRVLRKGRAYTPKATHDAERAIADAYRNACAEAYGKVLTAPAHAPVHLRVVTHRPLPASRPRSMLFEQDTYKPDWDNIGKITDALNGVAWSDDAQVTRAVVEKRPRERDASPQTKITVTWGDEIALLGG